MAIGYVHRPTYRLAVKASYDKLERELKRKLKPPNLQYGAHCEAFMRAAKAIDSWMTKNVPDECAMFICESTDHVRNDIKFIRQCIKATMYMEFHLTRSVLRRPTSSKLFISLRKESRRSFSWPIFVPSLRSLS